RVISDCTAGVRATWGGLLVLSAGAIARRQKIAEDLESLPRRHRRRVFGPRPVDRVLDELHLVAVAGGVLREFRGGDANDEHGPRELRAQRIVLSDLSGAVHADPLR